MTLLYTLAEKYKTSTFANFGSVIVYENCVERLRKYDAVMSIYDYFYKHGCGVKVDRIVLNGDQTLSPATFGGRAKFFDAMEKTGLEYITLASSIGDGPFDDLPAGYAAALRRCRQPLRLRETCDGLGVRQIPTLDQAFWKGPSHYESLMRPYGGLKPGEFTFQYQPWNTPGASRPFYDFGVDADVASVAEFDAESGDCRSNPLDLSLGNWLWLIGNCGTIYTSSYHAFALAVMFDRRIVCPCLGLRRFQSTMKLLGVRLSPDGKVENHAEVMDNVEKEREKVFDYVESIYSGGKPARGAPKAARPAAGAGSARIKPVYYNCRAKNKMVLDMSASGAVSAVLAKAVLDRGGLVYGAMYERDFRRVKVDWVDNFCDYCRHIAKSKYVYSFMPKFESVKRQLDSGRLVMVGALPCQIVALRRYLGRDYGNLYTSALKCHGATKPALYRGFVERIEAENGSRVFSADFRKNHGYAFSVRFEDGTSKAYGIDFFLGNDIWSGARSAR